MTTSSAFSGTGLSIDVKTPFIQGMEAIGNYAQDINSYTHTISASGGYLSASFNTAGSEGFAEDWLQNGLGRHITVYGPSVEVIWEGFVNQLDISMGGVSFSRGPLTNLGNRVTAWYTPIIEYVEGEAITGTTMPTLTVDDNESKLRYGIWEKIINLGTMESQNADYARDLFLAENSSPEGFPSINLTDNTGDVSINVQCRGYIDWLGYVYTYGDPEVDGTSIFASDKVIAILGQDPNDIISTSYEMIGFNGVLVIDKELDDRTAKTIIDEILTLGGGTDDRWTFGIYANRRPVFQSIPTEVEYIYYKNNRTQAIETIDGVILDPWNVVPCKWVAIPDILSSAGIKISYPRDDPRVFFAEEVTYTAPDQVTISGAKVRKLEQYLAKLGLGGG